MNEQYSLLPAPLVRISGVCQALRCDGAVSAMMPALDSMREVSMMAMNGHLASVAAVCLTALCGLLGHAFTGGQAPTH